MVVCTKCKYPDTEVVRVLHLVDDLTKRRRQCIKCGHRFNTIESAQEAKQRAVQEKYK